MKFKSYLVPLLLALLVHAVVVFVLAEQWFEPEKVQSHKPRHVNAQLVDLKSLNAGAVKKAQAEAAKKKAAAKAHQQAENERRKKAAAKKKREEVARKKAAAKKAADKKRKQLAAKNAAEKKQALARKKAEDAKRKKVQADKKAATEAKKAKAKAEAEKQRLEKAKLAEKARLAAEAKAREQARKDSLAQTIANEEALLEEEEALRSAMSYEAYVRDLISRHWRISPSARNGMKVELSIHLLPTGEVDNAYISQSSGDARFDRDAVSAVLRTARFPELQALDPVVFDRYYRKFTMIFRPEDLRY